MESNSQLTRKRQTAYKVRIKDLTEGSYVKEEGEWTPNYIEVGDKQVSRVNIIATVVSTQKEFNNPSIVLDDGSGKISVRTFNDNHIFKYIDIGDIVLIIGRPREFAQEKYLVPEIIKRIDNHSWLKVRKVELEKIIPEKKDEETIIDDVEEIEESPSRKIYELIKNRDGGDGVDTEKIISVSKIKDAEKIINNLLEEGEIFEIRPGKVRVLE